MHLPSLGKLFEFTQVTKLVCMGCKQYRLSENQTSELQINTMPLPKGMKIGDEFPSDFQDMLKLYSKAGTVEYFCTNCKANKMFSQQFYVKSWPKYLLFNVKRFIFEDWVPKKSHAAILLPHDKPMTFNELIMAPIAEGEKELPEPEGDVPKFEFSPDSLAMLASMGFSMNKSKRALLENNNDV